MNKLFKVIIISILLINILTCKAEDLNYKIVGTGVKNFYSSNNKIDRVNPGQAFYGQDANYQINTPKYKDNGDGTISDLNTGLTWQKDMGEKLSFYEGLHKADTLTLGGFDDWRIPTIKELYSLIIYTGESGGAVAKVKYIDTNYFNQPIGNTALGEREIDAQTWSQTQYKGLTMGRDSTVFGVNFIDGRIKGYPKYQPGSSNKIPQKMYFRAVRGNPNYGKNNFWDNGDGTVSDLATGLMWQKSDDGISRDWENSLSYAENLTYAGYDDWRLPSAKELQSIVDYEKSPQFTNTPAINSIFNVASIKDPNGKTNYPYYWSATTHLDGQNPYAAAVYIAFGEALGKMNGVILDVHGAGAQRSDPKAGNRNDYPQYFGPQGDLRSVYNYVRCVRTITPNKVNEKFNQGLNIYPNPTTGKIKVQVESGNSNFCLKVFNLIGETIYQNNELYGKNQEINIDKSGCYYIQVKINDNIYTQLVNVNL